MELQTFPGGNEMPALFGVTHCHVSQEGMYAHMHDHWVLGHEGHFVVMSFNVLGRIMRVPMY